MNYSNANEMSCDVRANTETVPMATFIARTTETLTEAMRITEKILVNLTGDVPLSEPTNEPKCLMDVVSNQSEIASSVLRAVAEIGAILGI